MEKAIAKLSRPLQSHYPSSDRPPSQIHTVQDDRPIPPAIAPTSKFTLW